MWEGLIFSLSREGHVFCNRLNVSYFQHFGIYILNLTVCNFGVLPCALSLSLSLILLTGPGWMGIPLSTLKTLASF